MPLTNEVLIEEINNLKVMAANLNHRVRELEGKLQAIGDQNSRQAQDLTKLFDYSGLNRK